MRSLSKFLSLVAVLGAGASGTSLQQLSMDDLIQESTGIVRASVVSSRSAFVGRDLYTYYTVQVLEDLKNSGQPSAKQIDVAVPGGAAKGLRTVVPGAPSLTVGQEYVIFLWTSKSGLTQVIGLSQGLFAEQASDSSNPTLTRPAAEAALLDRNGKVVQDQPVSMKLSEMRARVKATLARSGSGKSGAPGKVNGQ
jgi:hypothetical protein